MAAKALPKYTAKHWPEDCVTLFRICSPVSEQYRYVAQPSPTNLEQAVQAVVSFESTTRWQAERK